MQKKGLSGVIERFLNLFRGKNQTKPEEKKTEQTEIIPPKPQTPKPISLPISKKTEPKIPKQKSITDFKKQMEKEFKKPSKTINPKKATKKKNKTKPKKTKKKKHKKTPIIIEIPTKKSKKKKTKLPKLKQKTPIKKKTKPKKKTKKMPKRKQKPLRITAEKIEIIKTKKPKPKEVKKASQKKTKQKETTIQLNEKTTTQKQKLQERGELNIQEQIDLVIEKIKHLKTQFYKRGIDENEFRKKMFDYNEELHILEIEKSKGNTTINPSKIGKTASIGSVANQMFNEPQDRVIERIIERTPTIKRHVSKPEIKEKSGIITFGGKEEDEEQEIFVEKQKRIEETEPEIITLGEEIKKTSAGPSIRQAIQRKAAGKVDANRLRSIESKIDQLMKQYDISETEIKNEVERLDANKLIKDFDKLINLIELEHRAGKLAQEPLSYKPFKEGPQQKIKKEDVKSIIKEIHKHRIVTDLDRILLFVKENKTLPLKEISSKLNIDRKRIIENAEILEKHGLIRIEYPAMGEMRISDISYQKPTAKDKKKKKQLGELLKKATKKK